MPTLAHDPSVFIDDFVIKEFVEDLCDRLRRSPMLRETLNRSVGNRWLDLEERLIAFIQNIAFAEGRREVAISQLFDHLPEIRAEEVNTACEIFIESCLSVFSFHAAASFSEIGERLTTIIMDIAGSPAALRREKAAAADDAIGVLRL